MILGEIRPGKTHVWSSELSAGNFRDNERIVVMIKGMTIDKGSGDELQRFKYIEKYFETSRDRSFRERTQRHIDWIIISQQYPSQTTMTVTVSEIEAAIIDCDHRPSRLHAQVHLELLMVL
jgi:hypothetical protein